MSEITKYRLKLLLILLISTAFGILPHARGAPQFNIISYILGCTMTIAIAYGLLKPD